MQWLVASRHLWPNRTAVQRVTRRGGWFDAPPPNPRTVVLDSESSHAFWALVLGRERRGPADAARGACAMGDGDIPVSSLLWVGAGGGATPLRASTPQRNRTISALTG